MSQISTMTETGQGNRASDRRRRLLGLAALAAMPGSITSCGDTCSEVEFCRRLDLTRWCVHADSCQLEGEERVYATAEPSMFTDSFVEFSAHGTHRLTIPFDQIATRLDEFPRLVVEVRVDASTWTTAPRLLFDGKPAPCALESEHRMFRWECEPTADVETLEYRWDDGASSRVSVVMHEVACTGRSQVCDG